MDPPTMCASQQDGDVWFNLVEGYAGTDAEHPSPSVSEG